MNQKKITKTFYNDLKLKNTKQFGVVRVNRSRQQPIYTYKGHENRIGADRISIRLHI